MLPPASTACARSGLEGSAAGCKIALMNRVSYKLNPAVPESWLSIAATGKAKDSLSKPLDALDSVVIDAYFPRPFTHGYNRTVAVVVFVRDASSSARIKKMKH